MKGCWNNVSEYAHGTTGYAILNKAEIYDHSGSLIWKGDARSKKGAGWQQEHTDLFAALRRGEVPNEGEYGAKSTMTAILGRMATYGGKTVHWDDAINSEISLGCVDDLSSWDDQPPISPNENNQYPVAVPGSTKVV